ncbi:transposase [Hyella patelloides LEGE 07179]|uniref:Transposase n=1 Tax=Hyella patelloides LEGE 07179 TaxID=945734 RepID=A0A563VQ88_9CYAN|nr:RNA-guided endonuclease TnpB family protein [Hyella patelloides]VEP13427.1 transposase [Hyella patelloides LEGE 07179]
MLLGFKTELKVNNTQRILLAKHAGVARHAWNWGLGLTKQILDNNRDKPTALKDTASPKKIKFPTSIDLHKWLVALVKPECPWYYEVSKCAPQYALRHLRKAWDDCFKKVKRPPRFKKKGKSDSFTLDGSITVENQRIKVPRIGWLKTYEKLPINSNPKSVTISKRANKWFISWKIESSVTYVAPANNPVSVDLGLLRFATLSTGEEIHSPRPYKQLSKKLAKLQWRNRHKVVGSANWKKAQSKIAKLHYRIGCIRADFIHKLTTRLAKNHSHCAIEDLCISGLIQNRKLSKAIADSGWGEFRRQLEYKTELYGSELVIADRFFASSKLCPQCGHKKDKLPLNVRVYKCDNDSCDWVADRDYSAAINLLNLLGIANPDVMPVEKQEPTLFGEAGTNNQQEKDNGYVQLSLPLSNIV